MKKTCKILDSSLGGCMFLPNQRAKCLVRPGTSDNTAELDADSYQKNEPRVQ